MNSRRMSVLGLALCTTMITAPGAMAGDGYCAQQARETARRINIEVLPDLTANQRGRVQAIAQKVCEDEVAAAVEAANAEAEASGKSGADALTEYLLSGDQWKKPGQKRLHRH